MENIPAHPNTVVCIKHWPEDYIKIKVHGMWKPRDPPSLFECAKKSQIPTRPPPSRPTTKARFEARTSKLDELSKWVEIDHVGNFQAMKDNIQSKEFDVPLFTNTNLESEIVLQSTDVLEGTGLPRFLIKILHNYSFEAFHCGVKYSVPSLVANRITRITHWSEIVEMVRFLHLCETNLKKDVIHQQMKAMGVALLGEKKYSIETIVRAFEYFALSRSMYNRIWEDFELPCVSTLTNFTSKIKSVDDVSYISNVFSRLSDELKTCILILDEVYVKSMLQYHGGILFGKAK